MVADWEVSLIELNESGKKLFNVRIPLTFSEWNSGILIISEAKLLTTIRNRYF